MRLSVGEICKILNSRCAGGERVADGFSIDSRSLKPGELFFAIRGPRFDGHDFVKPALAKGAVAAVVQEPFARAAPQELQPFLVPVSDTAQALGRLARGVRRLWGRRLIAVTGSTGKTTTKELIAAVLEEKYRVLKSSGNLNNLFGLPQALLALERSHELAVVELAMSAPGEIARLAQIAEPEVGVVTNVAPVHLQFFDSLEGIAAAKRELIEHLSADRGEPTAVLNHDDGRVRAFARGFRGRVISFGFGEGAQVRGLDVGLEPGGASRFRVEGNKVSGEFDLPLPGRHNVENALAALAVASLFEISPEEARRALAGFRNLSQRSEILAGPNHTTVLNDSYNSNPRALESMLATLAQWPGARHRIVVAGAMLELGEASAELHRKAGRIMAASGVDWLIAVQGDARYFIEGAKSGGLREGRTRFFEAAQPAGEFCRGILEAGDVVLVKGSRGVHLETVTELLITPRAEPPAASPKNVSGRAI